MRLVETQAGAAARQRHERRSRKHRRGLRASLRRARWIGFKTIIIREFGRIMRIWAQTIVPLGGHLGALLRHLRQSDRPAHRAHGRLHYMQYIAPGLIMMAVITNSYGNVVSSFFGAKFGKHVEEMLVSPLPNWLIVLGYVGGGLMRGLLVGAVVSIVALFFTQLHVHHALIIMAAVLLTSMVFSLGGFINAMFAKNFDQVNWFPTFVLTPLTYFGGVFYSISLLPEWAGALSHANPILHMVNAFRFGFLGVSDVDVRLAFAIMVGFAVALYTSRWC